MSKKKTGKFQCNQSRECIDEHLTCNAEDDCSDGSDEVYAPGGPCYKERNCRLDWFQCDSNRCLRRNKVCDGTPNCLDKTDENTDNCKSVECLPNQFQCKSSRKCIPNTWVCDGHTDCLDNSDETGESCGECAEFLCNNKVCIPKEQVCNGINNCG